MTKPTLSSEIDRHMVVGDRVMVRLSELLLSKGRAGYSRVCGHDLRLSKPEHAGIGSILPLWIGSARSPGFQLLLLSLIVKSR
jgi:hypothetical protein